jgi:hypothetical protein
MSAKNRVNPAHYKVAGRDPQGENVLQEEARRRRAENAAGPGAGSGATSPARPGQRRAPGRPKKPR